MQYRKMSPLTLFGRHDRFGIRPFAGFLWHRALLWLLLKKQGNSTFSKVVKLQGRGVLASKYSCLAQTPCAKTREFGEAEFSDCLPVSASVCVFAFDTGGLGLWLGAFGTSMFYRCQSVPGPPMPFFFLQPAVWGFGLGLLGGQGFIGAKAPLDPRTPFLFFATGGLGLLRS